MMKKILFIFVENTGSQSFFKKFIPKEFEVISAGTKPSDKLNPIVLQAMNKICIDMKNQIPKTISLQIMPESEKDMPWDVSIKSNVLHYSSKMYLIGKFLNLNENQ